MQNLREIKRLGRVVFPLFVEFVRFHGSSLLALVRRPHLTEVLTHPHLTSTLVQWRILVGENQIAQASCDWPEKSTVLWETIGRRRQGYRDTALDNGHDTTPSRRLAQRRGRKIQEVGSRRWHDKVRFPLEGYFSWKILRPLTFGRPLARSHPLAEVMIPLFTRGEQRCPTPSGSPLDLPAGGGTNWGLLQNLRRPLVASVSSPPSWKIWPTLPRT